MELLATEEQNLIQNITENACPICFSTIQPGEGAVLRECFHTFCRSDPLKVSAVSSCAVKQVHAVRKLHSSMWHCVQLINRECLKRTILNSRDAEVACPEACESKLQDREIKAVIVTLFHSNPAWMQPMSSSFTVDRFTVSAAAEWRGALALPRVAPQHRRKPVRSKLSLPDTKLSRLVHLRGWGQPVPLRTLWWNQLHPMQGSFPCLQMN